MAVELDDSPQKSVDYKIPVPDDETEEAKQQREEDQQQIDNAQPLTEEEQAERDSLLTQGFGTWAKKDFIAFLKACEKFGRDSLDSIAASIEGKTVQEVKDYSDVFWDRHSEIAGGLEHIELT